MAPVAVEFPVLTDAVGMTPRSRSVAIDKAGGGPEDDEGEIPQPHSPRIKNHTGEIRNRMHDRTIQVFPFPSRPPMPNFMTMESP
jgi:hypothetical protein